MVRPVLRKWWKKSQDNAKRIGGLAEKEAAIKRKLELAMSILGERRKMDVPVQIERRRIDLDQPQAIH